MPNTYITLNQLMSSIEEDLSSYADAGLINRGSVIKTVRRVNEDIGLKLNQEKEAIIDVQNFKGDLPVDFMKLQLALACTIQSYNTGTPILGTHTIEHNKPDEYDVPVIVYDEKFDTNTCQFNSCGGTYWVTQRYKNKTVEYKQLIPLMLTQRSSKFCADDCVNLRMKSPYDVDISDEEIVTGFREGKVYVNYLSDMVNENGEVIVLDHPLLTDYYEYAVKKKILEDLLVNKEQDVAQLIQYIKNELRESRIRALSFVNTLEYTEIQDFNKVNRKRFYDKYIRNFDQTNYRY